MKKLALSLAFVGLCTQLWAQSEVLFTVNNRPVTTEEFAAVYNKNRGIGQQVDPKTPEEYLELYINFKLKVEEAYALGKDTAAGFVREFNGYREQLAAPYLTDKGRDDFLLQQAYERSQFEIKAAHIMKDLPADALPSDTLVMYQEMLDLRAAIMAGKKTFEDVARTVSTDTYSAKRGGDLGYFSVFNMVYSFENAAYNTPVGEISMPIRSKYGYHLVKVLDKRQASGEIKVAHILFLSNKLSTDEEKMKAENSALEIYKRLAEGADFKELAAQFSEDNNTASKGGELEPFGINRMMPAFEKAAFALENPGDFSAPVKSGIGWHVIQLVEKYPVGSFEFMERELKQKIKRDSRANSGQTQFLKRLKKEYNFTIDEKALKQALKLVNHQDYAAAKWLAPSMKRDRVIASFDGQDIYQSLILGHWQNEMTKRANVDVAVYLKNLTEDLFNQALLVYEKSKLEEKYPAYRNLIREYKEGILLFELTQEMVWNRALQDTTGLKAHYESIKHLHQWQDRIDVEVYKFDSKKKAKKFFKTRKKSAEKAALLYGEWAKENALSARLDAKMVEAGTNEFFDANWPSEAGVYGVEEVDGSYVVYVVKDIIPSGPKALKEIRGLVVTSYQELLSEQWVAYLRSKYVVEINIEVARALFAEL